MLNSRAALCRRAVKSRSECRAIYDKLIRLIATTDSHFRRPALLLVINYSADRSIGQQLIVRQRRRQNVSQE